jgi:protein ImuB
VLALQLQWQIDARRGSTAPAVLLLRLSEPTQDMAHVLRLLAERLAGLRLSAPVQALVLRTVETVPVRLESQSLLPDEQRRGESLVQLLERLGERLGSAQVQRWQPCDRHVPECMQQWLPALAVGSAPTPSLPQRGREKETQPSEGGWGEGDLLPTWLLPQPQPLRLQGDRPCHLGPLTLLVGPQRLESSAWMALTSGQAGQPQPAEASVMRDYFIARSAQAGLLWIYRERRADATQSWFLHGIFA